MLGKLTNGAHPRPATLWRVTVEAWLRCQGLIPVRQNQIPKVSTTLSQNGLTINLDAQQERKRAATSVGSAEPLGQRPRRRQRHN